MKIAMVINGFPLGSETFILNQALALRRGGHDIDLFLTNAPPRGLADALKAKSAETALWQCVRGERPGERRGGAALRSLMRNPLPVLRLPLQLVAGRRALSGRLVRAAMHGRRSYDVIHCHYGINGVRADLLRRIGLLEGPLATTFHGYDVADAVSSEGRGLYRRLFARGDLFLPVSDYWKDALVEAGCPEERILVHHMGVDCERFHGIPAKRGEDAVSIVSVGRFVEKKGFEFAVQAVIELLRQGGNLRYTLIGDGPLREPLLMRVAKAGMQARISMPGWESSDKVAGRLQRADIFLAPSVSTKRGDQEGIPVSIMEAMAAGLPVVSTHHTGIPELVEDGVGGLLCRERSAACLVRSLGLLAGNRALREEMGRQGRRMVERDFNSAIQDARLSALFEKLAGSPANARQAPCQSLGVEP